MRGKAIATACVAALLGLTGCSQFNGIYDIPLPGGADLGEHPYQIKVQFRDVLDLVPQSGVKLNEVPIGRVEAIGLAQNGWTAEVTLVVNGDVPLPANALANVRQSSLLGEKYVDLSAPPEPEAEGKLTDGALIPVQRTGRSVEVEEVLGALSMLLNGGGVDQLNTITKELNKATEGNEPNIKALLNNANELVSNLDQQSSNITHALDGLNRLSTTLNGQRDQIGGAIDDLGPGLGVLEQQRGQLVTMLQALRNLSGVAVDTVNRSQADLVADLKALLPTLSKLGEAGSDLPKSLEILLTYPFSDAAVAGTKGDYFNLYADVDLNLEEILKNLGRSRQNPLDGLPGLGGIGAPQEGVQLGAPPPLPLPQTDNQAASGQQSPPAQQGQSSSGPGVQPGGQQKQKTGASGIFDVLAGGAG